MAAGAASIRKLKLDELLVMLRGCIKKYMFS
jgi:hypothetical protein